MSRTKKSPTKKASTDAEHTPGPLKAKRVFVNNAPDQFHVMTGKWGASSAAICFKIEDAMLYAVAPDMLQFLYDLGCSRFWRLYSSGKADEIRRELIARTLGQGVR